MNHVSPTSVACPKRKPTKDSANNDILFPNGMVEIAPYSLFVNDIKNKPRKYIIEIHKYKGFAMIKYYPFHLKKNRKKFELRGEKMIGFLLPKSSVLLLVYECALLMRDYLEANQHEFIGYIGQTDIKDTIRKREQSQRCAVYNILTSSIFSDRQKYRFSSKKKFKEVNLRLIRLNKSKEAGKLTSTQMKNYNSFLNIFMQEPEVHYDLMTASTKERVINELIEKKNL